MRYSGKPRSSLKQKESLLPNQHWNKTKKKSHRKSKRIYSTLEEANTFIKKHKLEEKFIAYICPYCNKIHIGHKQKNS